MRLYERESVIILDEVQLFPRARSVIKYLVEDGRYDYIETGSLVSIRKNTEGILIPSEEDRINMYPMDFEEFLWAIGNETMMEIILKCYENRSPMGQALHRKAMNNFKIRKEQNGYLLEELNSRNGTKLNGKDIMPYEVAVLQNNSIIKVGKTEFQWIELS